MFEDNSAAFNKKKAETLDSMVTAFFKQFKGQINGSPYAHSREDGSFFFIPLGVGSSFRLLYSLFEEELLGRPVEYFLDAGSGLGNIVTMAYHLGLARNCHGLEYDKKYVGFSNKFVSDSTSSNGLRNSCIKYIHGDISTFKDYSKYDIIYYFCPFSDHSLERAFEEYVEDQMKVGAYLISCNKQGWATRQDKRFEQVDGVRGTVWKKISDGPRTISLLTPEHRSTFKKRSKERRTYGT